MIFCLTVATAAFPATLSRRRPITMRTPLIIDTDVGADDLATLAAAAAAKAPLCLVTTSSGLSPPGHGHITVRRTLNALGLSQVPVVAGAERPPAYVARAKADWEVEYGPRLDAVVTGCGIEPVSGAGAGPGSAANQRTQSSRPRRPRVAARRSWLGALTNVAAAWERQPEAFARSVERVVFIGDTQVARLQCRSGPARAADGAALGRRACARRSRCFPSRRGWRRSLRARPRPAVTATDAAAWQRRAHRTSGGVLQRLGRLDIFVLPIRWPPLPPRPAFVVRT